MTFILNKSNKKHLFAPEIDPVSPGLRRSKDVFFTEAVNKPCFHWSYITCIIVKVAEL